MSKKSTFKKRKTCKSNNFHLFLKEMKDKMKLFLFSPSKYFIDQFQDRQKKLSLTYREVRQCRTTNPIGYDNDHKRILLGEGKKIWDKAREGMSQGVFFPSSWVSVYPADFSLTEGKDLVLLIKLWAIYVLAGTRIVEIIDESNCFGFTYGTLEGHVETGEECFWIEKEENGAVFFHIKAFSRPAHFLVRLAYPFARSMQRRFVDQALKRMKKYVDSDIKTLVDVS